MVKTTILPAEHPEAIQRAVDIIQRGEPIAFPTDTVYGLGADAFDAASIKKLFLVKERTASRAIPILLGDIDHLSWVTAKMNYLALRLAEVFWPGPLTLVVPRHMSIPTIISPDETVGLRMPNHAVALTLLRQTGPLAVTSANISGAPSTRTGQAVQGQLDVRIPLILDGGRTPGGIPSTVVACTGEQPLILRDGPISLDDIKKMLA
ncbi:MAG: L-threonylcarbamoyladenylate synthase [Chloroflexota bacterium]|nr:L-threonylcarbamoyladenylate synthase [Chloroflexota bacterium]